MLNLIYIKHIGVTGEKPYLGLFFDGRETWFNKVSINAISLN